MTRIVLRLDHLLSRYGYCSRREAKQWIRAGRIASATTTPMSPSAKVDVDTVRIDDEPVECPSGILALLNKPGGFVCSHDSREGPTIYELLPQRWSSRTPRVVSVGRLDKDATGAVLITDLPAVVQRLVSPRRKVPKTYEVTVDHHLDPSLVELFSSGQLQLRGETRRCREARLEITGPCEARLELAEGLYHQVKRMFASQGYRVVRLHRAAFGEFGLDDLQPGAWRLLPITSVPSAAES